MTVVFGAAVAIVHVITPATTASPHQPTSGGVDDRGKRGGLAPTSSCAKTRLYLLFIHPGAPNLISLRSAGTMPA